MRNVRLIFGSTNSQPVGTADDDIEHVYQGRLEKLPALEELLSKLGLSFEQTAYVGDDVVDLPIMTRVGFAIAVQDAHPYVKKHAHWITQNNGGQGDDNDAGQDEFEILQIDDIIAQVDGLLTLRQPEVVDPGENDIGTIASR